MGFYGSRHQPLFFSLLKANRPIIRAQANKALITASDERISLKSLFALEGPESLDPRIEATTAYETNRSDSWKKTCIENGVFLESQLFLRSDHVGTSTEKSKKKKRKAIRHRHSTETSTAPGRKTTDCPFHQVQTQLVPHLAPADVS